MKLGNIDIADLRLGASQVSAWLGSDMIWGGSSPTPPTPTAEPLTFTAQEANCTVRLNRIGNPGVISLEYSTDGSTWTDYSWTNGTGDTLTLTNVGDKVYMRAKNENDHTGVDNNNNHNLKFRNINFDKRRTNEKR